ncbi:MAG: single-stranded-DNA-specific exonuclease RecJ [Firmicutes bacterium]|nr:single-stranded-DNA-specific exonuclease RecJ [Bacillota bacterium]
MHLHSVWTFTPAPQPASVERLVRDLGVSQVMAQLLAARGLSDPQAAWEFLQAGADRLHDPSALPDMDRAADRLARAVAGGELVTVYGDYDADGQTSVALLVRGLSALGCAPRWYIPDRAAEGYGVHREAVERLAAEGTRLLVTVDCGIQSLDEVRRARELGMDVIVTDHHEPGPVLPPALAVVNPKRADSTYPFRELAGVGVAYKLLKATGALLGQPELADGLLDLVALGTVADVCPLVGENRILVRAGLEQLNCEPSPGLAALLRVAGLVPGQVGASHVAFGLAPRLNAAGRVSHARLGVQLLLSDDPSAAEAMALRLNEENRARQELEGRMLAEALELVERGDLLTDWVLVVAGDGWHPGVIGIVASRLLERFARPAVVIGLEGEEGKGSARSIPGFDLFSALSGCRDLLIRFGGHALAAGFTVHRSRIEELRRRLNDMAASILGPADLLPRVRVDAEVGLDRVTPQLAAELARLAPFGVGNPAPVLAVRRVRVVGVRSVGHDGSHLRLSLQCPRTKAVREAVGFGAGHLADPNLAGSEVDVAFALQLGEWQGRPRAEMILRALRPPDAGAEAAAALDGSGRHEVDAPGVGRGRTIPVADRRDRAPRHPLARVAYLAVLGLSGARVLAVAGPGEDPDALSRAAGSTLQIQAPVIRRIKDAPAGKLVVAAGEELEVGDDGLDAWPGRGHLVFFGLPLNPAAFWRLLRAAAVSPGWSVHLVYGEAGIQESASWLERRYPGDEGLRWIFRALKRLSGPGGRLPPPGLVVEWVQHRWTGMVDPAGVRHAIEVFAELGLVVREDSGWRLAAPVPAKVDVATSVRYNDGVKTKHEFASFSRMALVASPARLIAAAAERSGPDGFAVAHPGDPGFSPTGRKLQRHHHIVD